MIEAHPTRLEDALAAACDEALSVDVPDTATVQEAHLAVVHLLRAPRRAAVRI